MKHILIILFVLLFTSCGSYKIHQRHPQVSNILAITNEGDTIQVPIQEFQRRLTPQDYSGWNIYWNNSWWMYNDWYWNYWNPNPRLFTPRYYIYTPRVVVPQQPRRTYVPQPTQPRRVEAPVGGRSNQPQQRVQQPIRQQPSRIQQSPRTPQRTQTPIRQQTPRTTRGGVIIKQ
jgi:hypothetical protein